MLNSLQENTGDFWVESTVPVLDNPSATEFLREAFSRYHPVILKNAIDDWPALSKWNKTYLMNNIEGKVRVNITPDGLGDAVKFIADEIQYCDKPYFTYPAETEMLIGEFYDMIESTDKEVAVPYLSEQNDNLRKSMPNLLNDIKPISIAKDAFGMSSPEAVNLWIGDERSISSMHKDHFENMYAVISGEKVFTLLPPTDIAFLPETEYDTLKYEIVRQQARASEEENTTIIAKQDLVLTSRHSLNPTLRWIGLDPDHPDALKHHPKFKHAHPILCKVRAGEVLYIPSMWLHRVTQTSLTVAVNYWFDQRFDFRYVFYQTVKNIANAKEEEGEQGEEQVEE
jgi:jumonji domain-containing protein 7